MDPAARSNLAYVCNVQANMHPCTNGPESWARNIVKHEVDGRVIVVLGTRKRMRPTFDLSSAVVLLITMSNARGASKACKLAPYKPHTSLKKG